MNEAAKQSQCNLSLLVEFVQFALVSVLKSVCVYY